MNELETRMLCQTPGKGRQTPKEKAASTRCAEKHRAWRHHGQLLWWSIHLPRQWSKVVAGINRITFVGVTAGQEVEGVGVFQRLPGQFELRVGQGLLEIGNCLPLPVP